MITVTFPDGSKKEFALGTTGDEIAKGISPKLQKNAVAIKVNDQIKDLDHALTADAKLAILKKEDPEALAVIRHSTAHLLAYAVQNLWPGTKVTIGPVIQDGFYYDFDFKDEVKLSDSDLVAIEKEMKRLLKKVQPLRRRVLSRTEAMNEFRKIDELYKVEIIQDLPETEPITIYAFGEEWFDLCTGPHVSSSKFLSAFKLTSIAGAYWRGDEKNKQLTRIYGTAWPSQEELDDYLRRLEEARKRDHRLVGKQMDLFSFHPEAPANPFYHPKGTLIFNQLIEYMRASNKKFGFNEILTPLILDVDLWHRSGHYDNYKENMYFTNIDERQSAVKPMNCPGHLLVYKTKKHSYRDLPLRLSEFGKVHRHERSGVTHGLFRARSFIQDDAHIFCTKEQIHEEVKAVLAQIDEVYNHLGFTAVRFELSTKPVKAIGSDEVWRVAEDALRNVLEQSGKKWVLNAGDGAFYGPKIDCHLVDSIGRSWQCGTVQLDFSMPQRFELEYQTSDDTKETPVMIHRAVLGSVERMFGILVEHYAGHFPLWLAPEQLRVIPIGTNHNDYGELVLQALQAGDFRATIDLRNERLGYKIREAQLQRVPYMVVVGDKEAESHTVSPRKVDGSQLESVSITEFMRQLRLD